MTIRNNQVAIQAQGSNNLAFRYLKLLVLTADKIGVSTGDFTTVPTLTQDRVYQPSEWNFTPQQSSSAVNNAELIPGLNDDVPDGLPDIGAIERGAPSPPIGLSVN